jgi:alpha-mannosidase
MNRHSIERGIIRLLTWAIGTTACWIALNSGAGEPTPAPAAPATNSEPLYLLTYDHGGLVLWGLDHFSQRLRSAISWLDKYPSFKIGLDNEAFTYEALAERNPQMLEEIRGWLKRYRGRFGIGTSTYGQPLSTFINEESNVRQLVQAVRADQKHLGYTPVIYLMSEHAMHSQLPQLLTQCGFQGAIMRTHFMMYGYNPTFAAPIGWWAGVDGSRLPTVPTYPGEGAKFGDTTVDNWILTRWPLQAAPKSLTDFRKQFASIHPLLASRADDSDLRQEALVQECEGKPEYRWLLLDELLQVFPKPTEEFKTQPNDFAARMPWGYCGNEIWNTSRQAEVQVLTAERLAALELLLGGTNYEAELETSWKNLLVGQHHDIQICGLLAEARRYLPVSLNASARVRDEAMQFFASRMKSEGSVQVTAFNPLPWSRRQWIESDVTFAQAGEAKGIQVKQGGQAVRSVLLSSERYPDGSLQTARVGFPADLGGLHLTAYSVVASKTDAAPGASAAALRVSTNAGGLSVVTPFCEARLHPEGGLASLTDRRTGQQWLKAGTRGGFFAATLDGEESQSKGHWTVSATRADAPALTATEEGFIGAIPYTFELTFYADSPRIDGRVKFHFAGQRLGRVSTNQRDNVSGFVHEQKLRFKLLPAVGEQAIGVRDLPFVNGETTNRYVEGNYWTALSDGKMGVAVFNRGTMGSVRESDGGFSVPLAFAMYYVWGTRMLNGDFSYEFALYPFTGDWRQQDLQRRALEYNFPVLTVSTGPGTGGLGDDLGLVEAGSDNVMLSALYPEGGRVLARLYEYQGRSGEAKVQLNKGATRLETVDLLGLHASPVSNPLAFKPWQIRTVRIEQDR